MAGASNVAMIVDMSRTSKWATTNAASGCVIACGTSADRGPGFPARVGPNCPEDLRSVPRPHVDLIRCDSGTGPDAQRPDAGHRQPWRERPSGHARGHFQRAHRGRSRHVFSSDRGTGACAMGGRQRRPSCRCRSEVVGRSMVCGDLWLAADDHGDVSPSELGRAPRGDDLRNRGCPRRRPSARSSDLVADGPRAYDPASEPVLPSKAATGLV